jgi:hypothetical protein
MRFVACVAANARIVYAFVLVGVSHVSARVYNAKRDAHRAVAFGLGRFRENAAGVCGRE